MLVSLDTPQNAYLLPRTDTAGDTFVSQCILLPRLWRSVEHGLDHLLVRLLGLQSIFPIELAKTRTNTGRANVQNSIRQSELFRFTGSPDNSKTELSGSISWSKSWIACQDHWHKFQNLHHSVPKLLSLHFHALVGCSLLLSVNRLFSFQKIYFAHSKYTGNCRRSRLLMRALALLSKIATNIMSVIEAN